jgi:N6-adenosine-specific RNA methylase IME4
VQEIERSDDHSGKPAEFRNIIDTLYPSGGRIELFARGKLPEPWVAWGAEVANECRRIRTLP